MKYGNTKQKNILHKRIEFYAEQLDTGKKKFTMFVFNDFLEYYFPYQPDFVVNTMIKLAESPSREARGIIYHMKEIKDPKFIPVLLKKLDFKDRVTSNHALDTLLIYDSEVITKVIMKLNKLDDCSKINHLGSRNSKISKKITKEEYKTYRCGN